MPIRPCRALLLGAVALAACSAGATEPDPAAAPPTDVDPAAPVSPPAPEPTSAPATAGTGPQEISLVADLGPLPDGTGRAVVETSWSIDAHGTRRLVVDTPAGFAEQHVMTDDEHWWWLSPEVRETIADAEWIHFDLEAIARAGGELPDVVAEARSVVPPPPEIVPGQLVAGREVLAAEAVGPDEVHLVVAGVERPVVHRRRQLPATTTFEPPTDAVDVTDLPGVLRW